MVQFEFNFNLGRGALWSFLHVINSRMKKTSEKSEKDNNFSWTSFFLKDILRGFTSMPLTFHISKFNFSISLSLDSMIWAGIGKFPGKNDEGKKEGEKNEEEQPNENNLSNQAQNNNTEENSGSDNTRNNV